MWSRTSAAAVIAPIRQGHRLTRRSALKVVLSSALPRSASARVAACRALTRALVLGQGPVGGSLDRGGDGGPFALVAQVAEGGVVLVGPLGQQRQHVGVGAQRGGVVLAAGPHARGPDRPAVGNGHDLHVAAVGRVLARPPTGPP